MDDELNQEPLDSESSVPAIPPDTLSPAGTDERYLELLSRALRVCADYRPKFGKGRKAGLTVEQFRQLYGADPFYQWVGLDSPLVYAAHKAAGGMTSIYRQLGIGSQWVFSAVLQDTLGFSPEESSWTYRVPTSNGGTRPLSLDGRIELEHIRDAAAKTRVDAWLADVKSKLLLPTEPGARVRGAVFEARQGYKSKDSKRQNADIANASNAFAHDYIPVLLLFSTQIDDGVAARYIQAQWLLLLGTVGGTSTDSTYVFAKEVLNYDLAGFYERNSPQIRQELETIVDKLIEA